MTDLKEAASAAGGAEEDEEHITKSGAEDEVLLIQHTEGWASGAHAEPCSYFSSCCPCCLFAASPEQHSWQSHYEYDEYYHDNYDYYAPSHEGMELMPMTTKKEAKVRRHTGADVNNCRCSCMRRLRRCVQEASSSSSVLACVMACLLGMMIFFMLAATVQWTIDQSSPTAVHHHMYGDFQFEPFYHRNDEAKTNTSTFLARNSTGTRIENSRISYGNESTPTTERPVPVLFQGAQASNEQRHAIQRLEEKFIINDTKV